jgi:uncharacterized protein involved in outer membrane biogenesis
VRWRRALLAGLGLLVVLLLAAGAAVLRGQVNLGEAVARYATARLGRAVTIGTLHITVGESVVLDVADAKLANVPGARQPDMVTLRHTEATLDPWALLRFTLVFRRLDIDGLSVRLEHEAGHVANWKFGAAANSPAATAQPTAPRATLPTMYDATLRDSEVTLRTSSGALLRIGLQQARLHSDGDTQPVTLSAEGSYNNAPATLTGTTQSFAALRDTAKPFGVELHLLSGANTLAFNGTMTDPLNFDGVQGNLVANIPVPGELLQVFGLDLHPDWPLSLSATLGKIGDAWHLDAAKGTLAASSFDGKLELNEGTRRQPDSVTTNLRFQSIDLKALQARMGPSASPGAIPTVEAQPGTLLDAQLEAVAMRYGAVGIHDFATHLAVIPGKVSLEKTSFGIVGGKAALSALATPAPAGTQVAASIALTGADIGALGQMLSLGPTQLAGRIDLRASAEAAGGTMQRALGASRLDAVLAMQGGSLPRQIIQMASVDLDQLFGAKKGLVRVSCLLAGANLRNLAGPIAPLRLRTADGTINGAGQIDLRRMTINLLIRTAPASTGFTALDVPIHISGAIASPSIGPLLGSSATDRLELPDDLRAFPPDLQQFARGNPCLREK